MAGKTNGLGQNLYVDGFNLSGDIGALDNISGGPKALDVTAIVKSAHERIGGQRDGNIKFTAFFNPSAGQEHPVLSVLPTTDGSVILATALTIGSPAACMIGKQLNYDPTRGTDGSLTIKSDFEANGFGLEWGLLLTPGLRTDSAATNGASLDGAASSAFGCQAYLEVTAFTGTDVTVKLQDSADNVTFADIAGAAFTQVTAANQGQRIAISNAATVRRYVRASTVTTGGFTSVTFAVALVRNPLAGQVF